MGQHIFSSSYERTTPSYEGRRVVELPLCLSRVLNTSSQKCQKYTYTLTRFNHCVSQCAVHGPYITKILARRTNVPLSSHTLIKRCRQDGICKHLFHRRSGRELAMMRDEGRRKRKAKPSKPSQKGRSDYWIELGGCHFTQ